MQQQAFFAQVRDDDDVRAITERRPSRPVTSAGHDVRPVWRSHGVRPDGLGHAWQHGWPGQGRSSANGAYLVTHQVELWHPTRWHNHGAWQLQFHSSPPRLPSITCQQLHNLYGLWKPSAWPRCDRCGKSVSRALSTHWPLPAGWPLHAQVSWPFLIQHCQTSTQAALATALLTSFSLVHISLMATATMVTADVRHFIQYFCDVSTDVL